MNIEQFLAHHRLRENPFSAEEARHDAVFARMVDASPCHPDFSKILGQMSPPGTSIVFGEKGSGKTAIRLQIQHRVEEHNRQNPDRRTLLVAHDDLNPLLDRLRSPRRAASAEHDGPVAIRLEDHQDAILSLAVTTLVDTIVGAGSRRGEAAATAKQAREKIRALPRRLRADLAVIAALYDQSRGDDGPTRWGRLRTRLKLGWRPMLCHVPFLVPVLALLAVGLMVTGQIQSAPPSWLLPLTIAAGAAALLLGAWWLLRHTRLWWRCRRLRREMPAIERSAGALRRMLFEVRASDLASVPWPHAEHDDRRYELTAKLLEVLAGFGYAGMMVVIDRVDEPTAIAGRADRMRAVIWPLLDNKFLQQDNVGVKLLLPLELRHLLHRESAEFFQEARLDKQCLVDRLAWSGATLYDLCSSRLRTCSEPGQEAIALTDLFDEDVSREMLVDALDQMQQPRDAFKFLYGVIQEHCRIVPEDEAHFRVARLTVDSVRRAQSQRVQELHRGLAPA